MEKNQIDWAPLEKAHQALHEATEAMKQATRQRDTAARQRRQEIDTLYATGISIKEIATHLGLSPAALYATRSKQKAREK